MASSEFYNKHKCGRMAIASDRRHEQNVNDVVQFLSERLPLLDFKFAEGLTLCHSKREQIFK